VGNPKRLELGDNSTPIPTFSHIQLDPIQEQYREGEQREPTTRAMVAM